MATGATFQNIFFPCDPKSINGGNLWLDGADVASTTMSGNNITFWKDKSGNGYNATAVGTIAAMPGAIVDSFLNPPNAAAQKEANAFITDLVSSNTKNAENIFSQTTTRQSSARTP
jgi:hypothetical protein